MNTCRCGASWTGQRTAHCAARNCHRTFSAPGLFDRHRRNGECVDPAGIDDMEFRDGMWRGPELPAGTYSRTGPIGGSDG